MSYLLSTKAVGDSVFLEENGIPVEYLVVNQGKPSSIYDDSCDGTWLLRKDLYETRQWHSSNVNDYANSAIHSYLNSTYLSMFSADIQNAIKTVKIPYRAGSGTSPTVTSGASGLSCKLFFLSGYELGWTNSDNTYFPADGAKLDYFDAGTGTAANAKRIAYLNGSATHWWSRSPYINSTSYAWGVYTTGSCNGYYTSFTYGVRPALVLPSSLLVSSDGSVATNTAPTITGTDGDLGGKTTAFSQDYAVYDADNDQTTVTEKVDGVTKRTFVATLGATNEFSVDSSTFGGLSDGAHTLTIEAADSQGASETRNFTFTKVEGKIVLTLEKPMECDAAVTLASMTITKSIAPGATFVVEVCNNGNDETPTWEDVTESVENNLNFSLENETKTADDWGYNIRITSDRNGADGDCWLSYVGGFFK